MNIVNNFVNIEKIYKNNGGKEQIFQYFRAGVLSYAVIEILRNGFSKSSLELSREAIQMKIQKKLKKRYRNILFNFDEEKCKNKEHANPKILWTCWFQGIDVAPEIVKKCINSMKATFNDYEIIIITNENYFDYVSFPPYILQLVETGRITKTHLSDLLRLELLTTYGGVWVDATVLFTDTVLPTAFTESELFMFQELKPGSNGHFLPMSSWYIQSKSNNEILCCTKELMYEYWRNNDKLIDYYLLHHFLNITKIRFLDNWERIPKYSNSDTHLLLLELFDKYDDYRFQEICRITPIHKLTYKFNKDKLDEKNTFYHYIMNCY